LALQILNLSIDTDYITGNSPQLAGAACYDDIDSITEYMLEKILGDSGFTSEIDDDGGEPQNKGFEKSDSGPLFFEPDVKAPVTFRKQYIACRITGVDHAHKTSKGYFYIVSPPPKA
jgi:hypothetical protein